MYEACFFTVPYRFEINKKTSTDLFTIFFLTESLYFNLLFHIIATNIEARIISYNKVLHTILMEVARLICQPLQHGWRRHGACRLDICSKAETSGSHWAL